MRIIDFFRNVNLELNGVMNSLFMIVLVLAAITVIILLIKRTVLALKTEGEIDGHLRETRARISRAVIEIEDSKTRITEQEQEHEAFITSEFVMETLTEVKTKDTKPLRDEAILQKINEEEVPCVEEDSNAPIKGKKTRAMAMEDRWAEYDKKRSMRNTA